MTSERFRFPGIPATADGSAAVVWVDSHITQGACAYPITPSTNMGSGYQAEVANGTRNLWGEPLFFLEPESEHSSASACEGFALAGGRVSNFTSGQGLVLMKEVLYTIAGKRLPAVFHIGARALTSQALNVHAGHDDVMAVADVGWGMLFAKNAQDVADLALIARRVAEEGETPFMTVQDGFLTTHTIENLLLPEPELMKEFIGDPHAGTRLRNLMNPLKPIMSGVVQNQDSYMKGKIAQRFFYDRLPAIVERVMEQYYSLTGRRYGPVEAYRLEDADYAIVGMGGLVETAMATVDDLRARRGVRAGALHVTCFRPFPGPQIVEAMKHLKAMAIIERMDNPTAQSNPLTAEIKAAFADALTGTPGYPTIDRMPIIYSGSAGLGSRDIRPGHFVAAIEHMQRDDGGSRYFVLGIKHDLALAPSEDPKIKPAGAFSMRGHSVGGFGSVTTNKVIATIVGDLFGLKVQAYPKYGSEKKGLPTTYYLTVAKERIRTHCELAQVDFVPLNDINAFNLGNPLAGLAEEGMVFIQTDKTTPEEVWARIPDYAKRIVRERHIRVLALDTVKIAREVASSADLEQRMQGIVLLGIFLRCTPFLREQHLTEEQVFSAVERSLRKYFGKRGEQVVRDNLEAVRRGYTEVFELPMKLMTAVGAGRIGCSF
ncbi:2-oxoacid:acceptor oxidoreductase family protein [Candidatus Methylomirabilis sp.]|uniref:2-oxoacid:acceptor oxidoreductase family protein n=1 Tax=Candidatus Methylomirabilis sp. TaxID=2032687 RepID=UPI002A647CEF|nr:2-oxoacid:acceptor oxidoreductase family protein [Candidatus Methylomirabilis sp.]